MKENRTGTKKFPALILFLLGFLAGNLIPNIIWKAKWQQKTWASVYFLSTFAGKDTGNIEYLKEILKYRGVFYLLNIICGFSVFGAPLAVITLLGSGLYAGMIMTVSILEFGLEWDFCCHNIYFTFRSGFILWNRNGRYHQKYGETEV